MPQKTIKGCLLVTTFFMVLPFVFTVSVMANERGVSRTLYPDLQFIEVKDLKDKFFDYMLIDVRTTYEYNLMHIEDALSIPVRNKDFVDRLHTLKRMSKLPIVLYANGGHSKNAHKAARLAAKNNIVNIKVLDAGINIWERYYPKITVFNGINGVTARISAKEIDKHTLSSEAFNTEFNRLNGLLVDIRENTSTSNPMGANTVRASLGNEKSLKNAIDKAIENKRTLFFYDDQGQQYQWLIYSLKQAGIKDFYFLEGGSQRARGALGYTLSQNR